MKFLLDSHTTVWAITRPESLSVRVRKLIEAPENTPLVSAATAWEVATKVRIGKWPSAAAFEDRFFEGITLAGFTLLPISAEVSLRAGRLPGLHKDPFDRLIAAEALSQDIVLLSLNTAMESFGVNRIS